MPSERRGGVQQARDPVVDRPRLRSARPSRRGDGRPRRWRSSGSGHRPCPMGRRARSRPASTRRLVSSAVTATVVLPVVSSSVAIRDPSPSATQTSLRPAMIGRCRQSAARSASSVSTPARARPNVASSSRSTRALLRGVGFRGSRAGPALQLLAPREQMDDEQRHEDDQRRQQADVVGGFHLRGELERATDRRVENRQQGQREARQQEPVVTQRNPQPHRSVARRRPPSPPGPAPRFPGAAPPVAACGCTQPRAAARERRSRVSLSGRPRRLNRSGRVPGGYSESARARASRLASAGGSRRR